MLKQSAKRNLVLMVLVALGSFLLISMFTLTQRNDRQQMDHILFEGSYHQSDRYHHQSTQSRTTVQSKIGKVSMLYGTQTPLYERALAVNKPHNDRFGYPFYVLRTKPLSEFWSKPGYLLQILLAELAKPEEHRLEWLFWLDVDTVIMNPNIPLEIFLPPTSTERDWSHIHTLVTNDHRGLNNGVFFLHVHPWSVDLMATVLSTPSTRPELEILSDQQALTYWLEQLSFRGNVSYVPQRWFNAYPGWRGPEQPPGMANTADLFSDPEQSATPGRWRANSIKEGDLLVHHAGHKGLRLQRMKPWVDIAERHLPAWELGLEDTTYVEEITEFWAEEARSRRDTSSNDPV